MLRTQQARATGLAGDFEEAARILDEIESSGLDASATHARARLAIERGRVLNSTGDAAAAAPYFADAHRLATDAGAGGLAIDALHMQAIAAGATDGPDAARAVDERALAEVEASDDPQVRRWLGSILNNLGWDLHDSGHPEEALAVFERAVTVRAEADDHSAWLVARWCVGRTLRTLGPVRRGAGADARARRRPGRRRRRLRARGDRREREGPRRGRRPSRARRGRAARGPACRRHRAGRPGRSGRRRRCGPWRSRRRGTPGRPRRGTCRRSGRRP